MTTYTDSALINSVLSIIEVTMKGFMKFLSALIFSMQSCGAVPLTASQSVNQHRWDYAISIVLQMEGGYSDDKIDPGGETNYGISLRYLESIGEDIDKDGEVNGKDIKAMTKEEAIIIYRNFWWNKYGYNNILDLDLATKIFSLSVNMGALRAHKLMQISINRMNDKALTVDGRFGQKTINAANSLNPHLLLDELKLNAAHYYINLIADKPKLSKYTLGWMRRAFS